MRRHLLAFAALTIVPFTTVFSQTTVNIRAGTPLKVKLERDVTSSTEKAGDTVTFRLAADYSKHRHVLISQGTKVYGVVSEAQPRSGHGKPGDITLSVQAVRAVDGQMIPLEGAKSKHGDSHHAESTVLHVLTLGLAKSKTGSTAVIPQGTEFTVYTAEKVTVAIPN